MRRLMLAAVLAALIVVPAGEAWTWPAGGPVLEPFLFDPAHPYAAGQHRGIVIGADAGAPVLAPAAGTVTFAGTVPSSGKSVTITTADGLALTLTHLAALSVAKNATVAEGDVVATAADSGDGDFVQPYVHLGIRVAADPQGYLDPLSFLPARDVPAPPAVAPPAPVEPAPPPAPLAEPEPTAAPGAGATTVAEPTPEPVAVPGETAPVQTAEPVLAPTVVAAEPESAGDVPAQASSAGRSGVDDPPAQPSASPATAPPAVVTSPPPRAGFHTSSTIAPEGLPLPGPRMQPAAARHTRALPPDVRAADARLRPPTPPVSRPREPGAMPRRARAIAHTAVLAGSTTRAAAADDRHAGFVPSIAGSLAVVLLAGLVGLTAVVGMRSSRRGVPTMVGHALLRDHTDLLRQRPAAHRSLVHDHRGRHPRAPSPAARRGDLLPDGRRRARDESLARR